MRRGEGSREGRALDTRGPRAAKEKSGHAPRIRESSPAPGSGAPLVCHLRTHLAWLSAMARMPVESNTIPMPAVLLVGPSPRPRLSPPSPSPSPTSPPRAGRVRRRRYPRTQRPRPWRKDHLGGRESAFRHASARSRSPLCSASSYSNLGQRGQARARSRAQSEEGSAPAVYCVRSTEKWACGRIPRIQGLVRAVLEGFPACSGACGGQCPTSWRGPAGAAPP